MIYLLSSQSLLNLLIEDAAGHDAIGKWKAKQQLQTIEISSVSIGQITHEINKESDAAYRRQLTEEFEKMILSVRQFQGIVPFDEPAAKTWAMLMGRSLVHDGETELSPESRMVVAVALTRNATLVEEAKRPYHARLSSLKVLIP